MLYYDNDISKSYPKLIDYFRSAIFDEKKHLGHCLLFQGPDIAGQCAIALEIARLLNCKNSGQQDCDCLNCRWIREQTHPEVKIYTRLDFKESSENDTDEDSSGGKKNITKEQAKAIINELLISSDYHRVYIFCDRDEEGNLLPLNKINFPEVTSNALLKTFEEAGTNATFIFLTHDKTDVISTVVSRAQTFFVPAVKIEDNRDFDIVKSFISEYWTIDKNDVLRFEEEMIGLVNENGAKLVFTQIQNYIISLLQSNFENKIFYYKLLKDLQYVEDAKRQSCLTPAMLDTTVCENLSFKLLLS